MRDSHVAGARRNAVVLAASAGALGALFLFPTSTNQVSAHRTARPGGLPAGVVGSAPTGAGGTTPSRTAFVVNGTSFDTRYGPVQVQLHISSGRITAAHAIDYPQGSGRDREINSQAIPTLDRETLAAQSGSIDAVSGATYTSDGYRKSLQAALDAAHLT